MKKKLMSTLLAIALLLTILPVGVSAEVDTTPPQVTITQGYPQRTSATTATVKFTTNEAGTCQYAYADSDDYVDLSVGPTFTCNATEQTITLENLTSGTKYMRIQVTDASDNSSSILYVTIPAYTTPTTTVTTVEIFGVVEPVNGEGPNFAWGKPTGTNYTRGDSDHYPIWYVSDTRVSKELLPGLITGGGEAYTYNQGGILAPESGNPLQLIFETGKWYTFIIELKAIDAVFTAETTATMNGNAAYLLCANPTTGYVAYSFQCTASGGGGQGGTPVLPGAANGAFPSNILMALLQNRSFKMTATAGEGGSISAEGTSKVKFARDITYTITPDEGCEIVSVTVDGKDMGPIGEYTFKKVRKAHRIEAVFAPKPVEEAPETPETEDTEAN